MSAINMMLWSCGICFLSISCLLILLFLFICIYLKYVHWKYSHIPGPPIENFFMGNLPKIRDYFNRKVYTHILFLQWAQEYGPVYRIIIMHKCLVVISGPTVIKEVLTNSKFRKSAMTYKRLFDVCGGRFLGNGLVTELDHDVWAKRRHIINPAFHKKLLRTLMVQFNQKTDEWIDSLAQKADGQSVVDMAEYLSLVTLDIIGQVGLGVDFQATQDQSSPFPRALAKILNGMSVQLRDPIIKIRPSMRQFVKDVQRAVRIIRLEGQKIIEERLGDIRKGKEVPENILTFIVKCLEDDPNLTMEEAVDDFCTIMIAGQETTSNMMAFLLKEVGRNPDVKQRLIEEIDRVLGSRSDITFEDVKQLEYTGHVIKETLRLYPPAMGTARDCIKNTVLNGIHIPDDAQLVVSFFVMHHIPEHFPDPEEFKPDRFSSGEQRKLFTYMPFSLGQRSCAGKHFAMIEAKVLICKFFQKFNYTLLPNQSFDIQETTTLQPKGGTKMILSLRA